MLWTNSFISGRRSTSRLPAHYKKIINAKLTAAGRHLANFKNNMFYYKTILGTFFDFFIRY